MDTRTSSRSSVSRVVLENHLSQPQREEESAINEKYNPEAAVLDEEKWYEDHVEEFVPGTSEDREALIAAAQNTMAEIENKNGTHEHSNDPQ